jgi:hypothetical protein
MVEFSDRPLDASQVDRLLVAATQDNELDRVVTTLLNRPGQVTEDARKRLTATSSALDALYESVHVERERLRRALSSSGVEVAMVSERGGARPLHVLSFDVSRADVDRAVVTLEGEGYLRSGPTQEAQWRASQATSGSCGLLRNDCQPFRIELRWPLSRIASGRARKFITPNTSDFATVNLPRRLWAGYSLVHLARIPVRTLRRRAEPVNLGPFLQTPDALIEPLLQLADLRADELLIDLGCGDGRIPITAAERFGCRARGIEYDPDLVARAQQAIAKSPAATSVEVLLGDASTAALDEAGVVVAFLPVGTLTKVVPDILTRMSPGARLVVHEQERLEVTPAADVQTPLILPGGVTVVHRWNR